MYVCCLFILSLYWWWWFSRSMMMMMITMTMTMMSNRETPISNRTEQKQADKSQLFCMCVLNVVVVVLTFCFLIPFLDYWWFFLLIINQWKKNWLLCLCFYILVLVCFFSLFIINQSVFDDENKMWYIFYIKHDKLWIV